jgi:hypothetical protein
VTPHLGGVEMKKNVGGNHHDPVTRRVFVTVPEDRLPDMTLDDVAFDFIDKAHDIVR